MLPTALLAAVALLPGAVAAQDLAPVLLAERAARPSTATAPAADGPTPSPRVVFTLSGDDNASAVHMRPDATGDGIPEVVVGWDIFKTGDNLQVASGASFDDATLAWSLETADGVSGGYFSGSDQIETFPDITGDGIPELLTGTSGGGRAATLYNGLTGAVLQSFDTYLGNDSGWVYDVLPLGDLDGDGGPDFVLCVGSDDNAVYAVAGDKTGVHHDELWRFAGLDAFFSMARIGDVNDDGKDDFAAASGDFANRVYGISGADGAELWSQNVVESPFHMASYPDTDGDGLDELVVGVWNLGQSIALIDGATGSPHWGSPAVGTFIMRVVPISDMNGDGWPEIAVGSWDTAGHVISGIDGESLWSIETGDDVWAVDRVDDVTGDGRDEVAFGTFTGFTLLADGVSGDLLWSHDANGHKVLELRSGPDVDGDGSPEVVSGAQQLDVGTDELLFVLDADSGVPGSPPEIVFSGPSTQGALASYEFSSGTPGLFAVWAFGFAATLLPAGPYGWAGLWPPQILLADSTLIPGSGEVTLNVQVPTNPGLLGALVHMQGLEVNIFTFVGRSGNRASFVVGG